MSNERIQRLLTELRQELDGTQIDDETLSLAKELDSDIHRLLDVNSDENDAHPILERARHIEAKFAAEHPVAERFVREIVDTLARMGI